MEDPVLNFAEAGPRQLQSSSTSTSTLSMNIITADLTSTQLEEYEVMSRDSEEFLHCMGVLMGATGAAERVLSENEENDLLDLMEERRDTGGGGSPEESDHSCLDYYTLHHNNNNTNVVVDENEGNNVCTTAAAAAAAAFTVTSAEAKLHSEIPIGVTAHVATASREVNMLMQGLIRNKRFFGIYHRVRLKAAWKKLTRLGRVLRSTKLRLMDMNPDTSIITA